MLTTGFMVMYTDQGGEIRDLHITLPEPVWVDDPQVFAVVDVVEVPE